jgi:hypothetical protein
VNSVVLPFPDVVRLRALDPIVRAGRDLEPADSRDPLDNVISLRAFARRRGRGDNDPTPREAA